MVEEIGEINERLDDLRVRLAVRPSAPADGAFLGILSYTRLLLTGLARGVRDRALDLPTVTATVRSVQARLRALVPDGEAATDADRALLGGSTRWSPGYGRWGRRSRLFDWSDERVEIPG